MAYSQPTDVRQTRDRAAVTTMLWREQTAKRFDGDLDSSQSSVGSDALKALTVEYKTHNIIVRRVQTGLLLVLVGPAVQHSMTTFKISAEGMDDPTYPDMSTAEGLAPENISDGPEGENEGKTSNFTALHLQRLKADKLVEYIGSRLGDYVMPDDTQRLATFP